MLSSVQAEQGARERERASKRERERERKLETEAVTKVDVLVDSNFSRKHSDIVICEHLN